MAAVTPVVSNKCIGTHADGTADVRFKCVKSLNAGTPVFNCTTMRLFRVSCAKINTQCNTLSSGYVAAVTCCNQKLF